MTKTANITIALIRNVAAPTELYKKPPKDLLKEVSQIIAIASIVVDTTAMYLRTIKVGDTMVTTK
jgi:hypothetical protein